MDLKRILISCRADGYRASVKDDPSLVGSGWNIKEALGDLVIAHPEAFGCALSRDGLQHDGAADEEVFAVNDL